MIKIKDLSTLFAVLLFAASSFSFAQTAATVAAPAADSANATIQEEVISETPEPLTAANTSQKVYVIQQPTAATTTAQALPQAQQTTQVVAQPQQQIVAQPQPVITQPTTIVEASPLVPSRAEEIRNMRQRAEVETEQKIVEKLEQSRLEDEKKRMNRIFGNNLDGQGVAAPQAPVAAPVQAQEEKPQQVIVVQQPQAEPAAPAKSEEQLKAEIAESVKADLQEIKDQEKPQHRGMAIGAELGTVKYDASNVGSDFAGGVGMTWDIGNGMLVSGEFLYSRHTIDEDLFSYQDMDQYNWALGLKYAFLPTRVTPVAGALLSYTRRSYSIPYASWDSDFSSDAVDAGLLVGVDIRLSDKVALGIDYRRMMNVEARYSDEDMFNRSIFRNYYPGYTPLEEMDYDMLNVALRFQF